MSDFVITVESPRHSNPFKSKKKHQSKPLISVHEERTTDHSSPGQDPFATPTQPDSDEYFNTSSPPAPMAYHNPEVTSSQVPTSTNDLYYGKHQIMSAGDYTRYSSPIAFNSSGATVCSQSGRHSSPMNDLDKRGGPNITRGNRTLYATSLQSDFTTPSTRPDLGRTNCSSIRAKLKTLILTISKLKDSLEKDRKAKRYLTEEEYQH
ncbi:hypothetical protein EJ05DRAFT_294786 [Pseudovirgaria hyperparasitica]|uniref:Uncharacterized protein n=1 Tax=Pseudovirgaria hyperparasitica TaxID=470096 RepID=A0A6A6VR36_9PEZI|nr:uncharacterized protein EJ05DRAFT_294786 [Pseudovirgaria hyperparasitica]KAF2752605.1 hypothetical protein EJ05DRAFT_294786 [Pseudovirgaria hyperparasitica]